MQNLKAPILGPGETAVTGQQRYNGVLWEAVFVKHKAGNHTLKALVEDGAIATLLAEALNKLPH